jgi:long-subunit acyl-CoA synthetase (AMP-forming)
VSYAFSFQRDRRDATNYGIPEISHDGLRAFVKFTGQQILIVNNDAFDWINVRLAVRGAQGVDHASSERLSSSDLSHSLHRVKSRGVYTIGDVQSVSSTSLGGTAPTMPPFSLEIRCDTPQGPNFWIGRWE